MTLPANGDIQSTSDEAERLLAELNDAAADQPLATEAVLSDAQSLEPSPTGPAARNAATFGLLVVPLALFIGFVVSLNHLASSTPPSLSSSPDAEDALMYRESCGSSYSSSGHWWPVLADPDRSLLAAVRNRYCGDAYINPRGMLQVASFNSPQEAEQLAERLTAATGASFRRGDSYAP